MSILPERVLFDIDDRCLFKELRIPECLHDVMQFAGVQFAPKDRAGFISLSMWSLEKIRDPQNWILTLPCKIDKKRIEIPIDDPISKEDPEGHWRAILGAAADFQYLVNTDQYELG